jgi:transposase InsO family protein
MRRLIARNLTDAIDGYLLGTGYLIMDRDPLFTRAFRATLAADSINSVQSPARSPNLNASAERFVRSVRGECLAKVVPLEKRICVSCSASTSLTTRQNVITKASAMRSLNHRTRSR